MGASATTTYELAARHKKVAAIVEKALEIGITAHDMQESMADEASWGQLARFAGVNRPSGESKALIIARMQEAEAR